MDMLWVIDSDKSFVQSFEPTEYASQIYSAIDLFNQGEYEKATELWQEVLRLNQMSVLGS
jgi:cytochrome c-type biogenesis protein CcmH/NrfG